MQVRTVNLEKDYTTLANWAEEREQSYPPKEFLSNLGLMIEGNCACFLYFGNSRVCLVEALISNKNLSKEERDLGLNKLFDEVIEASKDQECKYIYCLTESEALNNRLKKIGFFVSEKPTFIGLRVL